MLEIRVIGELEVRLAGTKAELPASRRARALLGWLAVHPGRHPRSRLAGQFWPDVLDASARASLRSALLALRSALGPDFGAYLATDRDTVTLAAEGLLVDLQEVRHLIAQDRPEAALDLCRGTLLQELDDDWVVEAREELGRDMAAALRNLTEQASGAGDAAAAVAWARRRAALCPLDEPAGADLIGALVRAGDAAAALEAFDKLQERLASELRIAVSAQTAALAGQLHRRVRPPGQARAPGTARPRGTPAPRGTAGPPGTSRRPDDPGSFAAGPAAASAGLLVGRQLDFAELATAWQAARNGSGGVVLLEGEGGIGKTRLVEELQATARRAGPVGALIAGATAAGPGPPAPFAVWTEALSDMVSLTGYPPEDQAWAADLARIGPALARTKSAADPPARAGADPQHERIRLCEAVVQLLTWASRQSPLMLAFEDLRLAGSASLELIAYAGRRLSRLPVLVILTRRRLPPRQDLDAVLGALRSRGALVAQVELRPLADDDARALIRASADLPDGTAEQIVTLAAGSPLLAVETARAAARDDTNLAAGLGGVVRLAVGRLSGQARVLVEFLAAAGRDLDRPEVAALPLASPARAAAEALGSGLLKADNGRTGFRHALLRDAAYQEIPDPIRRRLHGELAQLLRMRAQQPGSRAASSAGSRRGPRAAEIARHYRLAGQDEQAVSHLVLAARDARSLAATAEAAGFLAEAVQVEPGNPDLLIEFAEVDAFRGLLESSDDAFGRALEQVSPQDAGALISAWLRRGRWLRGGICHPRESRRSYQNALDVLDRDPASDLLARAEALTGLAWAEAVAGDAAAVDGLPAEADQILAGHKAGDLLAHDIGVGTRARPDQGGPVHRQLRPADRRERRRWPRRAPGYGLIAASAPRPAPRPARISSAGRWTSPTGACRWSRRTACCASASTRRPPGPPSCAG